MFHPQVRSVILMVALSGAVVGTAAAQVPDKAKVCNQVTSREPTMGAWASYKWTGGQAGGTTTRMAVVGKEPHEGTTYYWFEMSIEDAKRPVGKMIVQTLVPGLFASGRVRAGVMKAGDQPAMKMPPQMIQMINSNPSMNVSSEIARQCLAMEVVGWETVNVTAGQFKALHMRTGQDVVSDVWVQPDMPFAMVKATLKDGGVMELMGQGTGAKSSITETPVDMPGMPGAPPPR